MINNDIDIMNGDKNTIKLTELSEVFDNMNWYYLKNENNGDSESNIEETQIEEEKITELQIEEEEITESQQ